MRLPENSQGVLVTGVLQSMQSGLDVKIGDFNLAQHFLEFSFSFLGPPSQNGDLGIPICQILGQLTDQGYGTILDNQML